MVYKADCNGSGNRGHYHEQDQKLTFDDVNGYHPMSTQSSLVKILMIYLVIGHGDNIQTLITIYS